MDLKGGRIVKLSLDDNIILGTFTRIDGKQGNTHICAPNFNLEGTKEYGLPAHGQPRSSVWQVKTDDATYLSIYLNLQSTGLYKADLYIEQIFELTKDGFKQTVIVENTCGQTVPVNIGIHNYWATPGGWMGTRLNGIDIASEVHKNGQAKARKSNTIAFPDGRKFRLKTRDLSDIKLWTAYNDSDEFDGDYVCIEPVKSLEPGYFGTKQSLLKEGKAIGASQEISSL